MGWLNTEFGGVFYYFGMFGSRWDGGFCADAARPWLSQPSAASASEYCNLISLIPC